MKTGNNPQSARRSPLYVPVSFGLALLGAGLGLIFGAILGNLPIGALIGCVVGFIMGLIQDRQANKRNNP